VQGFYFYFSFSFIQIDRFLFCVFSLIRPRSVPHGSLMVVRKNRKKGLICSVIYSAHKLNNKGMPEAKWKIYLHRNYRMRNINGNVV